MIVGKIPLKLIQIDMLKVSQMESNAQQQVFPTYFFEMLKPLTIITLILSLAHTQVEILTAPSFNPPATPAPFQSLQNQYHYVINSNTVTQNGKSRPYTCEVTCSPRSFLTIINGLLVCQYDTTFWNFPNMNNYCIPDMTGNSVFCKSPAYTFILNQYQCKYSLSSKSAYSKLDIGCCYDSAFQSHYAQMQQRNPTNTNLRKN